MLSACAPVPVTLFTTIPLKVTDTATLQITTPLPTHILPSVTTTLFAEKVNTRSAGTFTPTPIFPTITPIPQGSRLWIRGNVMPTQRSELSSALLDGKIYVAGGTHVKGLTYARMEVYDP
jgi:hypothetical protein